MDGVNSPSFVGFHRLDEPTSPLPVLNDEVWGEQRMRFNPNVNPIDDGLSLVTLFQSEDRIGHQRSKLDTTHDEW